MASPHGRFLWYELMTSDMAAAKAFYTEVVGWDAHDASMPGTPYTLFTVGKTLVSGLLLLPEDARRAGAKPGWIGHVGVNDVDAAVARTLELGGAILAPPRDVPTLSRYAIIGDPQRARLALLKWMRSGEVHMPDLAARGRVGWHELVAADWEKAWPFYGELFGWQKMPADDGAPGYQPFSAGGETIGGMFSEVSSEPFWLYFFNVGDLDAATTRVKKGGGQILVGPIAVPGGGWIVKCSDPQGAVFALMGTRNPIGYFERLPPRGRRVE
jgi:uncharacterized protein